MSKVPMRSCIITKEKYPKNELLRVVRTPEGKVMVDDSSKQKVNGRGCYIKKDVNVIEEARKTGIIDIELNTMVPDEIYNELVDLAESKNKQK